MPPPPKHTSVNFCDHSGIELAHTIERSIVADNITWDLEFLLQLGKRTYKIRIIVHRNCRDMPYTSRFVHIRSCGRRGREEGQGMWRGINMM